MSRSLSRLLSDNIYLIVGLLIGLYISSFISTSLEPLCTSKPPLNDPQDIIPKYGTPKKTSPDPKKSKLVRPRYYSTELGIREKLFVGIFSSEEKILSQAVHLNRTIAHLVDQIKFFITAQYKLRTRFNVTGLVGFTDARARYRPFQVVKYIGDNFIQDYDYFFLAYDHAFINGHGVMDVVKKISVSMDVYLGVPVPDGSFCNLDAGIILSNSVVKAMREHLDWCVINAISDDSSENIGRCVYHSIGLSCQHSIQEQHFHSFKLKHFELRQHLSDLIKRDDFNRALTIHPILEGDSFYLLNSYFLRQRLTHLNNEIKTLSEDLIETWPPGQRPGAKPATRFDLPRKTYFNMTHMFFSDDFINIRPHTPSELKDIQNVIEEVKLQTLHKNRYLEFSTLINGYRTFDLSRGMDYTLDLSFKNLKNDEEVIKRFEVCKALGKVEFIPVPFTTENSRVTIILPIQEFELDLVLEFLKFYSKGIMERKEKTFLMLVLLYQSYSEAKGDQDVFLKIKNFATKTSSKYRNEDLKIAWVSVRLPEWKGVLNIGEFDALQFALVDLALKKIGLDGLVLILDCHVNITADFLNRVRMNTILKFQIFSPIPFRQYDPKITQGSLEITKSNGHFDREEYKYVSFYGKDYVTARKLHQKELPIVRMDNDISLLLSETYRNYKGNIFEMFVKHGAHLHPMRATEKDLKVKFHEPMPSTNRCNLFIANPSQLGRYLLSHQSQIPELK